MSGPYVGQLGAYGISKEVTLGTFVPPLRTIPVHLPLPIGTPDIALIESSSIFSVPDKIAKVAQGPGMFKSRTVKIDIEPANFQEHLMAAFGTDTLTETASFIVTNGNKFIDFDEGAGAFAATIATGTYKMGASSADSGSLCLAIKTALQAAGAGTYTVTFNSAVTLSANQGGVISITKSAGTFQLLNSTGTNAANSFRDLVGYAHTDTGEHATNAGTIYVLPQYSHLFTRLSAAQLPTYSLWAQNGLNFPALSGCMAGKLEVDIAAAASFIVGSVTWEGSKYNAGGAAVSSYNYSNLIPFKFDQVVMTVGGSPVTIYKNVKLSFNNSVKVDPVLGGSIYSNVIYAENFTVGIQATIVVEDNTELAKFIAGTSTSFTVTLTSTQTFGGNATPYSLTFTIPTASYKAAPLNLVNGLIVIPFDAVGVYTTSSNLTASATLVNSVGQQ